VVVGAITPVEVGLVKTLARPGGNVTGVTIDVTPEQAAKLVELLAEMPGVSRIAVLWSAGYPAAGQYRSALERAAVAQQRTIRFVDVLRPEDFDPAFSALRRMPADGLLVMGDQLMQTRAADIVRLAREKKLATVFGGAGRPFVTAGGLMSLSAELVINLKTAKALGLTIPRSLLLRADEVIE
jgi:putative ABC transport system substrate-binding protein